MALSRKRLPACRARGAAALPGAHECLQACRRTAGHQPEAAQHTLTSSQLCRREQQDLKKGAVTSAVLAEGSGAAPASGDLVVIQFRVLSRDASMQLVEGAVQTLGGEPVHVAVLGQGVRLPRAWELVLTGARRVAPPLP